MKLDGAFMSVKKKIAMVCANGLGDGLLSMVIANNLPQYAVTTFSNYLAQLRAWFPEKDIKTFPQPENVDKIFSVYDLIISTDGAFLTKVKHNLGNKYKILYEDDFNHQATVLENFLNICQYEFSLSQVTADNGLKIPQGLTFRKFSQRIIIHPLSTSITKNWLPNKFIKLARKLRKKDYEPVFVVGPTERQSWLEILHEEFVLPEFSNVDLLARFVYESGYMIGNDSGVGHLAANLGVPTLSLFARQSVANLWRPAWGNGIVVTPTLQLPGARLRTKHWQKFLTVGKVLRSFEELSQDV